MGDKSQCNLQTKLFQMLNACKIISVPGPKLEGLLTFPYKTIFSRGLQFDRNNLILDESWCINPQLGLYF